jgi:hypothetical protein
MPHHPLIKDTTHRVYNMHTYQFFLEISSLFLPKTGIILPAIRKYTSKGISKPKTGVVKF